MNITAELEIQTEQIFETMMNQIKEAIDAGDERIEHYLLTTAFALGFFIPDVVKPESVGLMTMQLLDAFIAGAEAGMQEGKVSGKLFVVRSNR